MSTNKRAAIITLPLALFGISQVSASPLEADAAVSEARYESSLTDFVNDTDEEVGGWIKANERVGEIGGWKVYLRQAQEPSAEQTEETHNHSDGQSMPGMKHLPSKGNK